MLLFGPRLVTSISNGIDTNSLSTRIRCSSCISYGWSRRVLVASRLRQKAPLRKRASIANDDASAPNKGHTNHSKWARLSKPYSHKRASLYRHWTFIIFQLKCTRTNWIVSHADKPKLRSARLYASGRSVGQLNTLGKKCDIMDTRCVPSFLVHVKVASARLPKFLFTLAPVYTNIRQ